MDAQMTIQLDEGLRSDLHAGYDSAIADGSVSPPAGYNGEEVLDLVHELCAEGGAVTSDGYFMLPDQAGLLNFFRGSVDTLPGSPGHRRLQSVWPFLTDDSKQKIASAFTGLGITNLLPQGEVE